MIGPAIREEEVRLAGAGRVLVRYSGTEPKARIMIEGEPREAIEPGPGQIDSRMPPLEMRATLDYDLSTVPHVTGVNNHMGSLLTTQPGAMDWLMRELA